MTTLRSIAPLALVGTVLGCAHHAAPPTMSAEQARSPGEHVIMSGGYELHFHVAGHGPVCIAHPGGPGADWPYLQMPEVEQALTMVYLEPIGTGASGRLPSAAGYTYERYVADLDAVRAALGLERVCILGHSAGGFTALKYAVAHPEHVSGLILYGTAPVLDAAWWQDVRSNLAWFANEPWYADAVAAFDSRGHVATDDETTAIFRRQMPLYFADWNHAPQASRERMLAERVTAAANNTRGPAFDVRAALSGFHFPTLVIVGERDFICSVRSANVLHDGIAGSELVVVPHAGHMAHLENMADFARAVVAFAPHLTAAPPVQP